MIDIKPFRSLKRKLTTNLVITFAILILLMLLVFSVVGAYSYDQFVYEQLEELARIKEKTGIDKRYDHNSEIEEEYIHSNIWVAHFMVLQRGEGVKLQIDAFTERLLSIRDEKAIYEMAELTEQDVDPFGKIDCDSMTYYYYFSKDAGPPNATMVYYLADAKGGRGGSIFLLAILFMIAIVPVSMKFAGKIAKPILELELFAEEVAKRNWKAETPETDNDEIGLLAQALDRMKDTLQESEERDRRFLQAASHDLKTPIMIIKGYAQAQMDGMYTDSDKDSSEIIKEEAAKLERRVIQLMHINALGHSLGHENNWSTVRMDRMLRSLTERFKVIRSDVDWETELAELEVHGDSDALLIAMENIFENQVRFAKNQVCIQVECDKLEGIIKVSNNGPRFEIEDPNSLFDPYRKDLEGQFGLGLSIVRQVVEGHGGTVEAYSLNTGVEFLIRLPKAGELT